MDHREKMYKEFKTKYDLSLSQIADIDKESLSPRERNRKVNSMCAEAIEGLGETQYGRKLVEDEDLNWIVLDLEAGLGKVVRELREQQPSESSCSAFMWADQCEEERRFKFLGGMGRIFNYFRDGAYSLDTKLEKVKRESLSDAAAALIERADSLLFHIAADLRYKDEVVSNIRRLSENADQLMRQLVDLPINRRDGKNLFHDGGDTIIVRQFSYAVSLLGFELYGWINPHVLAGLLEMKASTAEEYGLSLWLIDGSGEPIDRERKQRGFITRALNDVRERDQYQDWPTYKMIVFFSSHRKRFTERDGMKVRLP